jgi:phosphate-selective porin
MFKRLMFALAAIALLPLGASAQGTQAEPTADEKVDEVKGRVDSLEEQFAEYKGLVDSLRKLKLSGYVQARYGLLEATNLAPANQIPATANDGFFIRRGRLKAVYDTSIAQAVLQIDAVPSGVVLKQAEAVLKLAAIDGYILVGQTEFPFGYEVQASSADLALLERSRVVRAFLPGEYDRGVKAFGKFGPVNLKLGVMNGNSTDYVGFTFNGRNVDARPTGLDNDKEKDVIGRLGIDLGFVTAGVSGWYGQTWVPGAPASGTTPFLNAQGYHDRTRVGADAQLYLDLLPVGGTSLKGEFIAGKSPFASGREQIDIPAHGWYVQVQQVIGTKLELAARYDSYDPRNGTENAAASAGRFVSASANKTDTIAYGAHYYVSGNLKLSAVHEIPMTDEPEPRASNVLGGNADPYDQAVTFQLQARF